MWWRGRRRRRRRREPGPRALFESIDFSRSIDSLDSSSKWVSVFLWDFFRCFCLQKHSSGIHSQTKNMFWCICGFLFRCFCFQKHSFFSCFLLQNLFFTSKTHQFSLLICFSFKKYIGLICSMQY